MGWSIALTGTLKCLTISSSSLAIMKYLLRVRNLNQNEKKTKKKKKNFKFSLQEFKGHNIIRLQFFIWIYLSLPSNRGESVDCHFSER